MQHFRFLAFAAILISGTAKSQSQVNPGGVSQPSAWMANQDDLSLIGNYYSFDLTTSLSNTEVESLELDGAATVFMVLQPTNDPSGQALFRLGDVQVFDDHVLLRGENMSIDLKQGEPSLLTYQIQRPSYYALRQSQSTSVENANAFAIGELVIFDGILSREQVRKVNSYLALKYSVTITENAMSQWQDYWTPQNAHYWDTRIDRLYRERVIGLGRSDQESFYQTQTVTTQGEELWLSLGSIAEDGVMPLADMSDESFVIFSEKEDKVQTSSSCEKESAAVHPLTSWKFQLQNWSSDETELYIRVSATDKKATEDSLFLYDGTVVQYLPLISVDEEYWTYVVQLPNLQNFRHYFFTTNPQVECEDESIEVVDNQIVVTERQLDTWDLEVQSLADGSTTLGRNYGNRGTQQVSSGQYVVSVVDTNGNYQMMHVVSVGSSAASEITIEGPDIKIYPNPVERGLEATLEINDLPLEAEVNVTITDARGRILSQSALEYNSQILHPVRLNMPGIYTVIVRQGTSAYSLKHIVRASN